MQEPRVAVVLLVSIIGLFLFFIPNFNGVIAMEVVTGTPDGSEEWGYVEVRPKAHMFWWYYKSPYRIQDTNKPWPIILWLQGGPGASGVGFGNFGEIGPLDTDLNPRNSTWLRVADLLFVDNPVGAGYSYVEDENLLVKTNDEVAADLTTLLIAIFNRNESLQESPVYLVAESYGGKYAVALGLSAIKAIETGKLKLKLGGIALGDSWMSPEDFVYSWGPLLKDISRIDNNALEKASRLAEQAKLQISNSLFDDAADTWIELMAFLSMSSNYVDFHNFLLDSVPSSSSFMGVELSQGIATQWQSRNVDLLISIPGRLGSLNSLMNGVIRKKLKVIPDDVLWGGQSVITCDALANDFMRPRISEVDELLAEGVHVTVYNGQLDVLCSTIGVEAWVEKLKWDGLQTFSSMDRTPIYCDDDKATKGFRKSYRNLHFYWILGAGHYVPKDQPCIALKMAGSITNSPVATWKMQSNYTSAI